MTVGLLLNVKKTKVMEFNTNNNTTNTLSGTWLEVVDDFKYLGAWILSTPKDIKSRKALPRLTLYKMKRVWRSNLWDALKHSLFVSTVKSILLNGTETWTLTTVQEKALDGTYTHAADGPGHVMGETLEKCTPLCGDAEGDRENQRGMALAGHSVWHPELAASPLILWEPVQGKANRGRKRTIYISLLQQNHQPIY